MTSELCPAVKRELSRIRRELAPEPAAAFHNFSQAVLPRAARSTKTKNVIAVAVAHVTHCPYCIRGHTGAALAERAFPQELMDAIWVAAEMRAGGASAHSIIAIAEMEEAGTGAANDHPKPAMAPGEHHGH